MPDLINRYIHFSGITVLFRLPGDVQLPAVFSDLQCTPCRADFEITVCLIDKPLCPEGVGFSVPGGIQLYHTKEGWLRIHNALVSEDGCQVACLLCPENRMTLYYPASKWDFYAHPLNCLHLLGAEAWLLRFDAFLLHSAVVRYRGKTVLFSGPSGAGKSTQAALWAQHFGADVLNGDRCLIRRGADGGFSGGGSPWAGPSGIYRPECAPIGGIFLVHQSPENRVTRLGASAFAPLFSQTTVNSWDSAFMERVTALYSELLAAVPVYRLDCRPDRDAALLVRKTVFGDSDR